MALKGEGERSRKVRHRPVQNEATDGRLLVRARAVGPACTKRSNRRPSTGAGPKQQTAVYWCGPELLDLREGLKNAGLRCPVHQKFHGE